MTARNINKLNHDSNVEGVLKTEEDEYSGNLNNSSSNVINEKNVQNNKGKFFFFFNF